MKKSSQNQKNLKKSMHDLFQTIALLENAEEVEKFFIDLCTPAELTAIADRWLVVGEIMNGKPYRQIHDDTGVSTTTIGRVARCITYGTGGYLQLYEKAKKLRN